MYISREEARKVLGISISTLLRMSKEYGFRTKKRGKQNLILKDDVLAFLNDYELVDDEVDVEEAPVAVKVSDFMVDKPVKKIYQESSNCSYEVGRSSSIDEDVRQLAMSGYNEPMIDDNFYRKQSSPEELKSVFENPVVINPLAGIDFLYLCKLTDTQRDTYLKNWSINHAK